MLCTDWMCFAQGWRLSHIQCLATAAGGAGSTTRATSPPVPSAERTQNLVEDLRDDVIPKALEGTEMVAYVGGTTAGNIDLATKIGEKLPLVILIIVGLSLLLLTLAFRTMVVPALAARAAGHARLEILPGLRHAVYREDAAGFSRLLRGFLATG